MTERSIDYVRPVRVCQNKIKMKMSGTTLYTPHSSLHTRAWNEGYPKVREGYHSVL